MVNPISIVSLGSDWETEIITQGHWIIQDVRQGGKKDQDAKNRSAQLSALRDLASAANFNHDKER